MKTKTITVCGVFAAIICVLSVITIPIGPVPVTLGTLGIMLTAVILGLKYGTVSIAVYILLGAVGAPVFSGFGWGFQVLFGLTGGYIWSYIPMALLISVLTAKIQDTGWKASAKTFIACAVGMVVCYTLGTAQFMLVSKSNSLAAVMATCVIPFIPFDLLKALIASYIGPRVKRALMREGCIR